MDDITRLLNEVEQGDADAAERLLAILYDQLRGLAADQFRNEPAGHTLQPTALVHEAYLRLFGSHREKPWENRRHFFAAAAEAMRRVLIDNARRRKALKRGGAMERRELGEIATAETFDDDLLSLDSALESLERTDPDLGQIVKLRCFVGMTHAQIGQALGMSERTVARRWDYARTWLRRRMTKLLDR